MKSGTAFVLHGLHAPFEIEQVEIDSLRPDEEYVEMVATSICATETSVQKGSIPLPLPMVLGHEGVILPVDLRDC